MTSLMSARRPSGGTVRILLITAADAGASMSTLLGRGGYDVVVASSPAAARRAVTAGVPDLGVLDLRSLPHVDGRRVCRLLQEKGGDLTLLPGQSEILDQGRRIRLTRKEFQLLALLAREPGRVLTREAILRAVWGPQAVAHPEYAWALVRNLRKKIDLTS